MNCSCNHNPCNCSSVVYTEQLFMCDNSWKCNQPSTTTTSTTSTSTTTTTSSTTTTTTTCQKTLTIVNNTDYTNLFYVLREEGNDAPKIQGFVLDNSTITRTYYATPGIELLLEVFSDNGQLLYVLATLEVTGHPDDIINYNSGTTEVEFDNIDEEACDVTLTLDDTTPLTTTTTTTTSTTTTSTSTTTTTTSSTTTTTTTEGSTSLIIQANNIGTDTFCSIDVEAYRSPANTIFSNDTSVVLSPFVPTPVNLYTGTLPLSQNLTRLRVRTVPSSPSVSTWSVYYSNDNGSSFSLLRSFGPLSNHIWDDFVYNTPQGTGSVIWLKINTAV
jgi:hypothetical protein